MIIVIIYACVIVCAHISCCNLLYMFETRCAYRISYGTRRVAETFFWRQSPVIWRLLLLASLFSWHLLLLASFSWDALLISSHLISSHVFPPHLISSRLISPDVFSSRLVSSRLFSLLFQIALTFLSSCLLMSALLFSSCLRSSSPSFVEVSFSSQNRCSSSVFRRPKARAESRLHGRLDDSTLHSSSQLSSSPLFSSRLSSSQVFSSLIIY